MLKFIVVGPDGKPKMSTTEKNCIYSPETLKQMQKEGYTFLLNGKKWNPGDKIMEVINVKWYNAYERSLIWGKMYLANTGETNGGNTWAEIKKSAQVSA